MMLESYHEILLLSHMATSSYMVSITIDFTRHPFTPCLLTPCLCYSQFMLCIMYYLPICYDYDGRNAMLLSAVSRPGSDLMSVYVGSSRMWCLRMWCLIMIIIIRFDDNSLVSYILIVIHNLLLSSITSSNTTSLNSEVCVHLCCDAT